MSHNRSSLRSLPPELIEEIIIISTLLGDTYAAATLAQTCRYFRALVYHQFHKHLWREIFLVVFDNPRPAHEVRTHGRAPRLHLDTGSKGKGHGKSNARPSVDDFPWEDEYKRRIWTKSFILRRTRPPTDSPASHDTSIELPSTDTELYTVLQTLLRVISTAAPLPYDALACMESHCHPNPPHPHPIFAPLFVAAHARPTIVLGSRNTTWLAHVLAHGLPRALMARLTVFNKNGKVDVQKCSVKWDGLLAKLVAQIGLMTPITSNSTACPVEQPPHTVVVIPHTTMAVDYDDSAAGGVANTTAREEVGVEDGNERATRDFRNRVPGDHDLSSGDDDSDFEPNDESASESDEESESDIDGDELLGTTATPATTPNDDVRRLARIRVYNMAYLHRYRAYGPFLPFDKPRAPSSPSASKPDPHVDPSTEAGEDADEDEAAWSSSTSVPPVSPIPRASADLVDSIIHMWHSEDDEREESTEDEVGPASPGGPSAPAAASSSASRARRTHARDIARKRLRFDWAWIAAARLVIELNLRDLLMARHQGVLRALLSLEGLRSCSAPGSPPCAPPEAEGEGKGGRVFKDGEGWDWAGVEGQWRCVARLGPSCPVLAWLALR
ncbi:hypothetical protein BJV78DRAFT_1246456 [Lactifluus subvellereus]|nr:hypothetical protein BJV78DRAFT_1246456 [Lactifluus subvellereus]